MRTTLLAIMMIFSATISQASFLPPTSPQSNPSLVCHNVDMEIPENRLVVEVAPGTNENLHPFVTVKNDSQNRNSDILFASTVTEQRTSDSIQLFASGLEMEVTGDGSGIVLGTVRVQQNGNDVQEYRLNCHVMYYSMPVQAETM